NWSNGEVADDLERTLRFWLDLGVDGFRIDVAHGLAKPETLEDLPEGVEIAQLVVDERDARWDRPGVHDVHRRIRRVVDEYPRAHCRCSWSSWRCRGSRLSTPAPSWACRATSGSPATGSPTPPGSARATPSSAATTAACRCRGRARRPRTASRPPRTRGCRSH